MDTVTSTVNIHLQDDAPGPQVYDLSAAGDRLVAIELRPHPATVNITATSVAQLDRLIAAAKVARELLTDGGAQS